MHKNEGSEAQRFDLSLGQKVLFKQVLLYFDSSSVFFLILTGWLNNYNTIDPDWVRT